MSGQTDAHLSAVSMCPTCGCPMTESFDGGNDRLYEYCGHEHQLLRGDALAIWWTEHDKRCPGPGKCDERPPSVVCNVEFSPPRWLVSGLSATESVPNEIATLET